MTTHNHHFADPESVLADDSTPAPQKMERLVALRDMLREKAQDDALQLGSGEGHLLERVERALERLRSGAV